MKKVRRELLVFDWDGTLIDSAGLIVASLNAAFADAGLPPPGDAHARHVIGLGLPEAIARLLPDATPAQRADATERYIQHYLARERELETLLFDGVAEALKALRARGHTLAVATGKSRRGLNRALQRTGVGALFHATRCADETFSKPHPAMLEQLMDEMGVAKEATLMIGDTTHDLEMARNAGVSGVAVAWGAHPRAQLEALAPLACLDTPAELWQWLHAQAAPA